MKLDSGLSLLICEWQDIEVMIRILKETLAILRLERCRGASQSYRYLEGKVVLLFNKKKVASEGKGYKIRNKEKRIWLKA